MATWIGHLRVAENLLAVTPDLDETAFAFGNLGADSGKPNEDWSVFDPPKEVSHFLREGGGEDKIHDLEFYTGYLLPADPNADPVRYSYLLGYFFHLLSDNLWTRWIWRSYKTHYAKEYAEYGSSMIWTLKRDWYDLDFKYLHDYPASLFWRVLVPNPNPPLYLPFLTREGVDHSLNYIRELYTHPNPAMDYDRFFPFLNAATMDRYVADASAAILKIHQALAAQPDLTGQTSAIFLLPPQDLAPYDAPLGDTDTPQDYLKPTS